MELTNTILDQRIRSSIRHVVEHRSIKNFCDAHALVRVSDLVMCRALWYAVDNERSFSLCTLETESVQSMECFSPLFLLIRQKQPILAGSFCLYSFLEKATMNGFTLAHTYLDNVKQEAADDFRT